MSQIQAATAITAVIAQIIADHTTYPLVVEQQNMTVVDQALQTNPYLRVDIRMLAADQLDLADRPRAEQWGQIWLTATCKSGTGTAAVKSLLDFVIPYFDCKRLGIVQCKAVTGSGGKEVKGLWVEPAIVNFYYHRLT